MQDWWVGRWVDIGQLTKQIVTICGCCLMLELDDEIDDR